MENIDAPNLMKVKIKELRSLIKPFQAFSELKFSDNAAWFEAQKLLKSFPDEGAVGQWKQDVSPTVDAQVKHLESSFNLMKTTFLKWSQEQGMKIRESAGGWRVGSLLVDMQPQNMSIRFSYNRSPVTSFIKVADGDEIIQAYKEAESLLQKSELEITILTKWLWASYRKALIEADKKPGEKVYVKTVADEFSSKALRDTAYMKQMARKHEYPLWAFQYNLDRYRKQTATIPADMRIGTQTGSQQESNSGEGLTINGLCAEDDYKTICHVIPATANG